nr:MAG TPA: Transcriptional regulator [Caudoviricetes sp.]
MPRCARCGCPNPRQQPDPLGLALCTTHNTQFRNGTIGQDHNPRQKQFPTTHAAAIIQTINHDHFNGQASIRQLATHLGLPKDCVHNIQRQKWKHVRSKVWEQLLDAAAEHTYQQNQQKGAHQCQTPTPATATHGDSSNTGHEAQDSHDGQTTPTPGQPSSLSSHPTSDQQWLSA